MMLEEMLLNALYLIMIMLKSCAAARRRTSPHLHTEKLLSER